MTSPPQRPEDENLGIGSNLLYGLQHVLTMYGGIVAVPLIVGQAAGLSPADIGLLIAASLFVGGAATLLQTLGLPFFGCQLPLVQGVSFASVATLVAIVGANGGEGGLPVVFGAVIGAAVIGLLITPIFSKITKFFPPLVTGIVITTIGLTLMPVAACWAMGGNSAAADFGSMANIGLAAFTLATVLLLSKVGSATLSRLSILLAMVIGTLVALAFGMADFSKVSEGPVLAFPAPLHFGMPVFEVAAIVSMLIVVMVILVETSADILAVGDIIDTRVDSKRLGNGMRRHDRQHHRAAVRLLHPERLRSECRPGCRHRGQESLRGGHRRADSGHSRPAADHGPGHRRGADLGARRRGYRAVRHGGGQRHPHPGQGGLPQQHRIWCSSPPPSVSA